MKKQLPKSLKKYIRREKARVRREIFDINEQKRLIFDLCLRLGVEKTKPLNP